MKYSHYCTIPCYHCKRKLTRRNNKNSSWFVAGKTIKYITFNCKHCTECVYDEFGAVKIREKIEFSYHPRTGKLTETTIVLGDYKILFVAHPSFKYKCYISKNKPVTIDLFMYPNEPPLTASCYSNILNLTSDPKFDFTNPTSILNKIKLLLTFS